MLRDGLKGAQKAKQIKVSLYRDALSALSQGAVSSGGVLATLAARILNDLAAVPHEKRVESGRESTERSQRLLSKTLECFSASQDPGEVEWGRLLQTFQKADPSGKTSGWEYSVKALQTLGSSPVWDRATVTRLSLPLLDYCAGPGGVKGAKEVLSRVKEFAAKESNPSVSDLVSFLESLTSVGGGASGEIYGALSRGIAVAGTPYAHTTSQFLPLARDLMSRGVSNGSASGVFQASLNELGKLFAREGKDDPLPVIEFFKEIPGLQGKERQRVGSFYAGLLALLEGKSPPSASAFFAVPALSSLGLRLLKDSTLEESDREAIARVFLKKMREVSTQSPQDSPGSSALRVLKFAERVSPYCSSVRGKLGLEKTALELINDKKEFTLQEEILTGSTVLQCASGKEEMGKAGREILQGIMARTATERAADLLPVLGIVTRLLRPIQGRVEDSGVVIAEWLKLAKGQPVTTQSLAAASGEILRSSSTEGKLALASPLLQEVMTQAATDLQSSSDPKKKMPGETLLLLRSGADLLNHDYSSGEVKPALASWLFSLAQKPDVNSFSALMKKCSDVVSSSFSVASDRLFLGRKLAEALVKEAEERVSRGGAPAGQLPNAPGDGKLAEAGKPSGTAQPAGQAQQPSGQPGEEALAQEIFAMALKASSLRPKDYDLSLRPLLAAFALLSPQRGGSSKSSVPPTQTQAMIDWMGRTINAGVKDEVKDPKFRFLLAQMMIEGLSQKVSQGQAQELASYINVLQGISTLPVPDEISQGSLLIKGLLSLSSLPKGGLTTSKFVFSLINKNLLPSHRLLLEKSYLNFLETEAAKEKGATVEAVQFLREVAERPDATLEEAERALSRGIEALDKIQQAQKGSGGTSGQAAGRSDGSLSPESGSSVPFRASQIVALTLAQPDGSSVSDTIKVLTMGFKKVSRLLEGEGRQEHAELFKFLLSLVEPETLSNSESLAMVRSVIGQRAFETFLHKRVEIPFLISSALLAMREAPYPQGKVDVGLKGLELLRSVASSRKGTEGLSQLLDEMEKAAQKSLDPAYKASAMTKHLEMILDIYRDPTRRALLEAVDESKKLEKKVTTGDSTVVVGDTPVPVNDRNQPFLQIPLSNFLDPGRLSPRR